MKAMTGKLSPTYTELRDVLSGKRGSETVTVKGMVHALHDMGGITFATLRGPDTVLQCVFGEGFDLQDVTEECAVAVSGSPGRSPGPPAAWS